MSGSKRVSGTRGKHKRVSNGSSLSPTIASSNPTLSKSASMRSTGFVSPNGTSSLANEHEEDDNENGSKPSNVWCESHELTSTTSTADKTTVNSVVTEQMFPKVKFVDKDTDLVFSMEKNRFVNLSLGFAICTQMSHYPTGGSPPKSTYLKLSTVYAMIATQL
jgi:hypothetical protein